MIVYTNRTVGKNKNMNTTKEKILEKAKKLFAKKGYESTSMSEVAAAANIEKSSLYYFFKNKEGLFIEILESIWKELIHDIYDLSKRRAEFKSNQEHFAAILEHFINQSLEGGIMLGMSEDICAHMSKPKVFKNIAKCIECSRKLLHKGLKEYGVKNPEIAEVVIGNACHAYIVHKQYCKKGVDVKKYADYLSSILIKN